MHLLAYRNLRRAPFRHSSWLSVEAVRESEGAAGAARESDAAVYESRESEGAGLFRYWEGAGGQ